MFIFKALKKMLFLDNNDNTVIGLSELKSRDPRQKVQSAIKKSKKLDDVKLCDLIRGID